MGCQPSSDENKRLAPTKRNSQTLQIQYQKSSTEKVYDVDVIEVSNIALAIKKRQPMINIEIVVSCKNLPTNIAQELNSFVLLFRCGPSGNIEIGKTEIVNNDLNPKYLATFIVAYNHQSQDQIEFQIFKIIKNEKEEGEYSEIKIGAARANFQELIQNQQTSLPVNLKGSSHKDKSEIKISCSQYDGSNIEYQIDLSYNKFGQKSDFFYVVEVLKDSEWMPIAKSKTIRESRQIQSKQKKQKLSKIEKNDKNQPVEKKEKNHKTQKYQKIERNLKNEKQQKDQHQEKSQNKFHTLKIPANKFFGDQNARIRFRIFELTKQKVPQDFGVTEETTLMGILNSDQKVLTQRVDKNGQNKGNIVIQKWKKSSKNSFISYIVNGARLHLILGIDFTNSNFVGQTPLHNENENENQYVVAIKQIVGMLQFFDYYNQIALYGFGAKLPPYYKCVGQRFALNGNYFQPIVSGGVSQIIKLYQQTLKVVKPHGPSKLSQIIEIAINYSKSGYESTNYYVLVLITDGKIDDYNKTVDLIVEASSQPLSIVVVGVGDKDFTEIQQLDQQNNQMLVSTSGVKCERDMIDFINFRQFMKEKKDTQNAKINRARKIFSQIPSQFVQYMKRNNINPSKQKKGLKAAKTDFINDKIKQYKTNSFEGTKILEAEFLKQQKKKMKKQLIALGFDVDDAMLQIPVNDLTYFFEVYSSKMNRQEPESQDEDQIVAAKQQRKFEQYLQKKQESNNKKIQQQIYKIESNQNRPRRRIEKKTVQPPKKSTKQLLNPCLKCKQNEICIMHIECGHLAVCQKCQSHYCFICKNFNHQIVNIYEIDDVE